MYFQSYKINSVKIQLHILLGWHLIIISFFWFNKEFDRKICTLIFSDDVIIWNSNVIDLNFFQNVSLGWILKVTKFQPLRKTCMGVILKKLRCRIILTPPRLGRVNIKLFTCFSKLHIFVSGKQMSENKGFKFNYH